MHLQPAVLLSAVFIMVPLLLRLLAKQCFILKNLKSLHIPLLYDLLVAQLIASLFFIIIYSFLLGAKNINSLSGGHTQKKLIAHCIASLCKFIQSTSLSSP